MNVWDWLWLAWLALFLPIEVRGIRKKIHGATLSEHCWWWFCWKDYGVGRRLWRTRRAVFCLFWAALSAHFILGLEGWPWLIVPSAPFALTILISAMFEPGVAVSGSSNGRTLGSELSNGGSNPPADTISDHWLENWIWD